MKSWLLACFLLCVLSACQSVVPSRWFDVALDDGNIQSFALTKHGALPADDGTYKVEQLGLMLYEQDKDIHYAWDVMVNLSKQNARKIKVSQVLNDQTVLLLLEDDDFEPERPENWLDLKSGGKSQWFAKRWRGVWAGERITQVNWLKDLEQETMFVFKIEIWDVDGKSHVLYQPMFVSAQSKQAYAKIIETHLQRQQP